MQKQEEGKKVCRRKRLLQKRIQRRKGTSIEKEKGLELRRSANDHLAAFVVINVLIIWGLHDASRDHVDRMSPKEAS